MSALYSDTSRTLCMESALEEFNVFTYFKEQEEGNLESQIFVHQGFSFRKNFVNESRCMELSSPSGVNMKWRARWTFGARTLTRPTTSFMLWDCARSQYTEGLSLVTIAEICKMVNLQKDGSNGFLLVNGKDNVFFAVDAFGYVRIVHVRYSAQSSGWGILSWPVFSSITNERDANWQPLQVQVIFRKLT